MKRKIKLTEKDLKLKISKNGKYTSTNSVWPNTKITNCYTTTLIIDCPATSEELDCKTTTMGLDCPTATYNTECLSAEATCNCAGTQGCVTPTDNCEEPLTDVTQCGGCESNNCNQTNTCNCNNETKYCFNTQACIEPATAESECHVCESYDDCYISGVCQETEVCEASDVGRCESFPCLYSENNCEQPNSLIVDCESVEFNCITITNCGND